LCAINQCIAEEKVGGKYFRKGNKQGKQDEPVSHPVFVWI
jgi:hypothetical protein